MAIGINLQKLLSAWNIRGMMMISLGVQIVLAFAAPFRMNTSRGFIVFITWSTYLLADWAAIYAFGLISNTIRTTSVTPLEINQNILALWASFLLIHVGGPDTITAYSLEDNSLWMRHFVRLLGQLAVFVYIFLKTFPGNNLVAITTLVLATGVMKYAARTMALFLASLDNLKNSIGRRSIVELPEEDKLQHCYFFERFRGMILDIMPRHSELEESREFFKESDAKRALEVIAGELKLMYEVLYTKIMAVYSKWGIFSRSMLYVNTVAALVLFSLSRKDQFDGIDIGITYCLLVGVFVIDVSRSAMHVQSDWVDADTDLGTCCKFQDGLLTLLTSVPNFLFIWFSLWITGGTYKSWSQKMGAFSLLDCSIQKYCHSREQRQDYVTRFLGNLLDKAIDGCGLTDGLDKMTHTRRNKFDHELWEFIFKELKLKAWNLENEGEAREVYESKGESVLLEMDLDELKEKYMEDFDYDKGVLCWHIATEICYNVDKDTDNSNKEWSKILSDYLLYLLIHQPKLTAAIIGIGHERYAGTCLEVKELANKLGAENLKDFCTKVLEGRAKDDGARDQEKGEGGNYHEHEEERNYTENCEHEVKDMSVLADGCDLAMILMNRDDKWEIIAKVWVEMLSYAAGHCRADMHARTINKGGEVITHVWLLMGHFGITAHWSKK